MVEIPATRAFDFKYMKLATGQQFAAVAAADFDHVVSLHDVLGFARSAELDGLGLAHWCVQWVGRVAGA